MVFWVYLRQRKQEIGNANADQHPKMSIAKAHALLGHANEDIVRKTAGHFGWTITKGSMGTCAACTVAKA